MEAALLKIKVSGFVFVIRLILLQTYYLILKIYLLFYYLRHDQPLIVYLIFVQRLSLPCFQILLLFHDNDAVPSQISQDR